MKKEKRKREKEKKKMKYTDLCGRDPLLPIIQGTTPHNESLCEHGSSPEQPFAPHQVIQTEPTPPHLVSHLRIIRRKLVM